METIRDVICLEIQIKRSNWCCSASLNYNSLGSGHLGAWPHSVLILHRKQWQQMQTDTGTQLSTHTHTRHPSRKHRRGCARACTDKQKQATVDMVEPEWMSTDLLSPIDSFVTVGPKCHSCHWKCHILLVMGDRMGEKNDSLSILHFSN